mmetsp:Transcript_33284/g.91769  ORF Transcript_33284/g.91769 Transcript_33284/m.91769 type:complete len:80 (+) Transcript_33284:606-845(+)
MDWKEKPSGKGSFLSRKLANEFMPSAVTARAGKKRTCKSGDWTEDPSAAAAVLKKPPWSQPGDVNGPDPKSSQRSSHAG